MKNQIKIVINTDNAAFCNEDGNQTCYTRNFEVARILKNLAKQLEERPDVDWNSVILMDINGNSVGSFTHN